MNVKILDRFSEENSTCLLVSAKLDDYIQSLPVDYKDYEVQREIVKNTYLDNLIDTVLKREHIPLIVLVSTLPSVAKEVSNVEVKEYKILDGLQRTYRLKILYDSFKLVESLYNELRDEIYDLNQFSIAKIYKKEIEKIRSSSNIISKLINYSKISGHQKLLQIFNRNQWFEIWLGLNPDQEVKKMLILNAGHKSVKTKHQIELLFRSILPLLQNIHPDKFSVIREKEQSSVSHSKKRELGQFHFSHLITSLLSFQQGKPLTGNVDFIQKVQNENYLDEGVDTLMQFNILDKFILILYDLDSSLTKHYGDDGTKWMGRETSLVGLFAAVGKFRIENSIDPITALDKLNLIIDNPASMDLRQFESLRNNQDLAKINIGTVNKSAVYNGVYELLSQRIMKINWTNYFKH